MGGKPGVIDATTSKRVRCRSNLSNIDGKQGDKEEARGIDDILLTLKDVQDHIVQKKAD